MSPAANVVSLAGACVACRCFISPLLMTKYKSVPLLPFLLAFLTHAYIGLLHGLYFVNHYQYKDEWLYKPNFCIGKDSISSVAC